MALYRIQLRDDIVLGALVSLELRHDEYTTMGTIAQEIMRLHPRTYRSYAELKPPTRRAIVTLVGWGHLTKLQTASGIVYRLSAKERRERDLPADPYVFNIDS